jgi:hypothetical protein
MPLPEKLPSARGGSKGRSRRGRSGRGQSRHGSTVDSADMSSYLLTFGGGVGGSGSSANATASAASATTTGTATVNSIATLSRYMFPNEHYSDDDEDDEDDTQFLSTSEMSSTFQSFATSRRAEDDSDDGDDDDDDDDTSGSTYDGASTDESSSADLSTLIEPRTVATLQSRKRENKEDASAKNQELKSTIPILDRLSSSCHNPSHSIHRTSASTSTLPTPSKTKPSASSTSPTTTSKTSGVVSGKVKSMAANINNGKTTTAVARKMPLIRLLHRSKGSKTTSSNSNTKGKNNTDKNKLNTNNKQSTAAVAAVNNKSMKDEKKNLIQKRKDPIVQNPSVRADDNSKMKEKATGNLTVNKSSDVKIEESTMQQAQSIKDVKGESNSINKGDDEYNNNNGGDEMETHHCQDEKTVAEGEGFDVSAWLSPLWSSWIGVTTQQSEEISKTVTGEEGVSEKFVEESQPHHSTPQSTEAGEDIKQKTTKETSTIPPTLPLKARSPRKTTERCALPSILPIKKTSDKTTKREGKILPRMLPKPSSKVLPKPEANSRQERQRQRIIAMLDDESLKQQSNNQAVTTNETTSPTILAPPDQKQQKSAKTIRSILKQPEPLHPQKGVPVVVNESDRQDDDNSVVDYGIEEGEADMMMSERYRDTGQPPSTYEKSKIPSFFRRHERSRGSDKRHSSLMAATSEKTIQQDEMIFDSQHHRQEQKCLEPSFRNPFRKKSNKTKDLRGMVNSYKAERLMDQMLQRQNSGGGRGGFGGLDATTTNLLHVSQQELHEAKDAHQRRRLKKSMSDEKRMLETMSQAVHRRLQEIEKQREGRDEYDSCGVFSRYT